MAHSTVTEWGESEKFEFSRQEDVPENGGKIATSSMFYFGYLIASFPRSVGFVNFLSGSISLGRYWSIVLATTEPHRTSRVSWCSDSCLRLTLESVISPQFGLM